MNFGEDIFIYIFSPEIAAAGLHALEVLRHESMN